MNSWEVVSLRDGPQHVLPLDDLRPHHNFPGCWCGPRVDDGIWVHNSMDGREAFEHGERKAS